MPACPKVTSLLASILVCCIISLPYLGSLIGRSQLILQAAPHRVITLIVADHQDVSIDAEALAQDLPTLDSLIKLTTKVEGADEIIRDPPFPEKLPGIRSTSNLPIADYIEAGQAICKKCTITGAGLNEGTLSVGQRACLTVILEPGDEVSERIRKEAHFAYATFENNETIFSAIARFQQGSNTLNISYSPSTPGNFTLTVDFLALKGTFPVTDKRYSTIQVIEDQAEALAQVRRQKDPQITAPRCVGLPDTGQWMKCTASGLSKAHESCFRWGYTFRPTEGCYYDNWTSQELAAYATTPTTEKKWLLILGSSKIRGVFLSAVDHLIKGIGGQFEGIQKCWGRMDVEVGHLRITYQDFRAPTRIAWPLAKDRLTECHGENVAVDGMGLYHNSTSFIENIFDDPDDRPTALVIEFDPQMNPEMHKAMMFDSLPESWQGPVAAIYFRGMYNSPLDGPPLTQEQRNKWSTVLHRPVDIVDTSDLIQPWLRFAEDKLRGASQHWHSCTKKDMNASFAVDGVVTDALAQMLFNQLLGDKPEMTDAFWEKVRTVDGIPPKIKACTDCPFSLLPFHIKPLANLTCYDHIPLKDYTAQYLATSLKCPEWCLQMPTSSTTPTQSGPVEVRYC